MSPLVRTTGKIVIALALETLVVLAFRAHRIRPFFAVLCTVAATAFAWPWLAHQLGRINTAILLTVVYVLAAGPMKLFGGLGKQAASGPSFWQPRPAADPAIPERRRLQWQF